MYSLLFKMRAKLGLGIWGVQIFIFHGECINILRGNVQKANGLLQTYHIWVWSWAGRGGCTLHRRRALLLFLPELHSYLHLLHQALIQLSYFHHHLQTLLIQLLPPCLLLLKPRSQDGLRPCYARSFLWQSCGEPTLWHLTIAEDLVQRAVSRPHLEPGNQCMHCGLTCWLVRI